MDCAPLQSAKSFSTQQVRQNKCRTLVVAAERPPEEVSLIPLWPGVILRDDVPDEKTELRALGSALPIQRLGQIVIRHLVARRCLPDATCCQLLISTPDLEHLFRFGINLLNWPRTAIAGSRENQV